MSRLFRLGNVLLRPAVFFIWRNLMTSQGREVNITLHEHLRLGGLQANWFFLLFICETFYLICGSIINFIVSSIIAKVFWRSTGSAAAIVSWLILLIHCLLIIGRRARGWKGSWRLDIGHTAVGCLRLWLDRLGDFGFCLDRGQSRAGYVLSNEFDCAYGFHAKHNGFEIDPNSGFFTLISL